MDFKKVLLWIIVILILYLVWTYVFKDGTSQTLYSGGDGKTATVIQASKLVGNPAAVDFSFSIWIYVNTWQYKYGKTKCIYRRKITKSGEVSPEVVLAGSTNDLTVSVTTYPDKSPSSTGILNSWSIHNIPIQKWCNIIISTNNRAVDTYIDGKLVNTHVLKGVPKMDKNAPIEITPDGGFSGETAKFKYYARNLSPRECYEIYRDGPGSNWFADMISQYKLKLAFMKNNEEINSFQI